MKDREALWAFSHWWLTVGWAYVLQDACRWLQLLWMHGCEGCVVHTWLHAYYLPSSLSYPFYFLFQVFHGVWRKWYKYLVLGLALNCHGFKPLWTAENLDIYSLSPEKRGFSDKHWEKQQTDTFNQTNNILIKYGSLYGKHYKIVSLIFSNLFSGLRFWEGLKGEICW